MSKKVFIACGHGRSIDGTWDSGCTYGKYSEAALMLPITKSMVSYLRGSGVIVYTDADANNNKNMISDVAWANKVGVDAYMSLHCDYKLATSGSMPLFKSEAGRRLATYLNRYVKSDVIKTKGLSHRTDLFELNATDMPACIFETGSIGYDIKVFEDYDDYGAALAHGMCDYLGVKFKGKKKTTSAKAKHTGKVVLPARGYFNVGDTSWKVINLQVYLAKHGYYKGKIDGIYGPQMRRAVMAFERKHGLSADGEFGRKCLAKI